MKKPMYAPLNKSYSEDINDLVEEQFEKGGPGSGKRGHRTAIGNLGNKVPRKRELPNSQYTKLRNQFTDAVMEGDFRGTPEELVDSMGNDKIPHSVQIKAATEVLRAKLGPKFKKSEDF